MLLTSRSDGQTLGYVLSKVNSVTPFHCRAAALTRKIKRKQPDFV